MTGFKLTICIHFVVNLNYELVKPKSLKMKLKYSFTNEINKFFNLKVETFFLYCPFIHLLNNKLARLFRFFVLSSDAERFLNYIQQSEI